MNRFRNPKLLARRPARLLVAALKVVPLVALLSGCGTPMGADKSSTRIVYEQVNANAISSGHPSAATKAILHRFDQDKQFEHSPDAALNFLHQKAVENGERDMLFALSELNYLEGERVRRSVKPWEPRDARDYYLASAVYAWFFIFQSPTNLSFAFDDRFRTACDFYNHGLGWALTERRATNAVAVLQGGTRKLPVGQLQMDFSQPGFPWPLTMVSNFILADRYLVRGLSVRNRQPGLGTPLIAVSQPMAKTRMARNVPATVFLRIEGGLADLSSNQCHASLELYTPFVTNQVTVGKRMLPLETDTTVPLAYTLNNQFVWKLDMGQFLSGQEMIPTDVYLTRPYQPGRVPVVFVHGTFSSPIWWAEMINTLSADPVLTERCQFWYFIYNSGNPIPYSAALLRKALTAKVKELDPEGKDPALQQMVVIGHSQGGLLTKLTATDTGDQLWHVINTNSLDSINVSEAEKAMIQEYVFFQRLPFVTRVVFIATPHRGSYLAGSFVRNLVRKLVSLPGKLVDQSKQIAGLQEKINMPKEMKGMRTSLDGMSPKNPIMLKLAEIPTAPGVKANSIVAVEGDGDYREGKDGLVKYSSAHVDYVESEFIVRSFHSCLSQPATIEEVRRILREHVAELPVTMTNAATQPLSQASP